MKRLLEMIKGNRNEQSPKKRYPMPIKNGNYLLNSGDERQMQEDF